jgi:hypothetical protein
LTHTDIGLRHMATNRRWAWLLLSALNLALALAVWTRQGWANGPAEWRWQYLPAGEGLGTWAAGGGANATGAALQIAGPPTAAAIAVAALTVVAALLCLGACAWHRRLAAWRGVLAVAIAAGAALTFGLVALQPGGFGRVVAALVSRNSFGYVWDAALAPPTRELLADFPAAADGLNQHSVTHPPGPLLVVRSLGWLDRILPQPSGVAAGPAADAGPARARGPAGGAGASATASAPATAGGPDATPRSSLPRLAAAAIAREVVRARTHARPMPQPPPGPWAVVALALLLPALSALTAWPLYQLALRFGCERSEALLAALLWLLVPARSLFTPSFDQALPLLVVAAAALAAGGGKGRAAAAGLLCFGACFLSYGCLPALPLIAACAVAGATTASFAAGASTAAAGEAQSKLGRGAWRRATLTLAVLALGFLLPYLVLAIVTGFDPWQAMRAALELHRRIALAPRSYGLWLLWNPYDFALLLSPAVLALAGAALLRPPGAAFRLVARTWWGLLALLLVSGSVRGEVGRIWLLWMPFACLLAAGAAGTMSIGAPGPLTAAGDPPAGDAQYAVRALDGRAGTGSRGIVLVVATEALLALALAANLVFVN